MRITCALLLAVLFAAQSQAYEECKDTAANCKMFKSDCKKNPRFFKKNCAKTCGYCGGPPETPAPFTGMPPLPANCGKPAIQGRRVIAGVTAVRGSWPWQILLLYRGQGGCGGTIVGPRHIITAAHCVAGRESVPSRFWVRVGEHNRGFGEHEGSEEEYQVEKVFRHPDYEYPTSTNNDIAILKLKEPIKFNKYVSPACLPEKDVPVGTDCYITGWGKVRHPGNGYHILQQAKMPVVSNEVCHRKNFPRIRIPVTDAMICSGDGGETRKSGCHGDSGGPFVCQVNGRWELHGAVSHGSPRCSSRETYTVYARVTHFKNWIYEVMSQ